MIQQWYWILAPCIPNMPYAQYVASMTGVLLLFLIAGSALLLLRIGRQAFVFALEQYYRLIADADRRIAEKDAQLAQKDRELQRSDDNYHDLETINDRANKKIDELRKEVRELKLQLSIRTAQYGSAPE